MLERWRRLVTMLWLPVILGVAAAIAMGVFVDQADQEDLDAALTATLH